MKNRQAAIYLLLSSAFFMGSVQAHAPSEHMKKAEKPKCEAMKDMDHSKMDMKDPIMMAMMKKCMSNASSDHKDGESAMKKPEGESHKEKEGKQAGGHDH